MSNFFFIRHGQSESNIGLAADLPQNVPLTEQGEQEARHVAVFFKKKDILLDLVVTSPYKRARQTAQPTKEICAPVAEAEWEVQEFTYLSPAYLGRSTMEQRRPLVEAYWEQKQPSFEDGPGAESFEMFIKRVIECILRLRDLSSETIVVFSHEQFINAVIWVLAVTQEEILKEQGEPVLTRDEILEKYQEKLLTEHAMRKFRRFLDTHPLPNGAIVECTFHLGYKIWGYELIMEHLALECQRM